MKTKIKQLVLVSGALILGAFFTFNVFTANAQSNQSEVESTVLSVEMSQSIETDFYAVGDEGKCGEGKCGEGKKSESKKETKKEENKKEEKKEKKSSEKKKTEKKKSESKCGEGKCG